jgi:hypothetical protein
VVSALERCTITQIKVAAEIGRYSNLALTIFHMILKYFYFFTICNPFKECSNSLDVHNNFSDSSPFKVS